MNPARNCHRSISTPVHAPPTIPTVPRGERGGREGRSKLLPVVVLRRRVVVGIVSFSRDEKVEKSKNNNFDSLVVVNHDSD